MFVERRGNLFSDEVYRLSKAQDATTPDIPSAHKFSPNDVIMLTLQPKGTGDFFDPLNLPIADDATKAEARVLNVGPTYVDIAMQSGIFGATFGPAPNDASGQGNPAMRIRVDRFFSDVPYQRMVSALSQMTSIPTQEQDVAIKQTSPRSNIRVDEVLREAVIATHAFGDPSSPMIGNPSVCDLNDLDLRLRKPPMKTSPKLAAEVLHFLRTNAGKAVPNFNLPQLTAIQSALTQRMTMIQGPPGTGKTLTGAAIGFGFAHQCRSISPHTKVLACAFSNVGADNLAEALLKFDLKVVRIGKPGAVSKPLWDYTLEAAISRDPEAQNALSKAAEATAELSKAQRSSKRNSGDKTVRNAATSAVKFSIEACNIAATRAIRDADVIVSTCSGAADPRLLAACAIDDTEAITAPDGLPPVSLPFVLVDEAGQSLEPATLIPIIASNSCRSLVLLGDPCQLPPTVKSDPHSSLSQSLMERLADSRGSESLMLLSHQYRMDPSIAAFPSAQFYRNRLVTPDLPRAFPKVLQDQMPCGDNSLCVRFLDVGGRVNESRGKLNLLGSSTIDTSLEEENSYWNEAEAERVVALLIDILGSEDPAISTVGVITPYSAQVQLIQSMVNSDENIQSLLKRTKVSVEVNSVDGYQGRERDIIIFSAVRSNKEGNIGFLRDWRRLNVALTRAKSGLVLLGDLDTLAEADSNWSDLRKWASKVRCIVNDYDDNDDMVSC